MTPYPAPEWATTQWFNSAPLSLDALRDRIVVLGAFQMLCHGCVAHGLPQMRNVDETFRRADIAEEGLHPVFENHSAMSPDSL